MPGGFPYYQYSKRELEKMQSQYEKELEYYSVQSKSKDTPSHLRKLFKSEFLPNKKRSLEKIKQAILKTNTK